MNGVVTTPVGLLLLVAILRIFHWMLIPREITPRFRFQIARDSEMKSPTIPR